MLKILFLWPLLEALVDEWRRAPPAQERRQATELPESYDLSKPAVVVGCFLTAVVVAAVA
jgi:hypothetical protein